MPTTNLGLPLVSNTERGSKDRGDWQKDINGSDSGTSAFQKIDDFAGTVKKTALQVVIAAGDWTDNSCTKTATGVTATNTVTVAPDPTDYLAYGYAQIRATTQSTNSLTFVCTTTPTEEITVNVVILGV